ncbi:phage portal protein [Sphingomonas sp.]|uniref:phage portal protein n=1 Tax=Sphingomonas sp. TaxID=28214 RepID=UPI002CEDBD22|nr:phage portal protein [Sphingomonas sp.]HTG39100.1 phage portal protein [Sphingomonas sp.]
MKWFGRKAAGREGARPLLGHAGQGARIGEWPVAYADQVREGYCGNPVAQRAVRLVAETVASAPVEASDPALAAMVAERSNGQPLMETLAAQMLLHGNAYAQILGDGAGGVAELFALRPERVGIDTDANGWPVAYRYGVGARVMTMPVEDAGGRPGVIHIRHFHPLDDHLGLGCLGAAMGAIAIHNAATRWNKALLDNAARPSGALVYDPGDGSSLSAEQFRRLKAEMAAAYQGAGNAGRPMLLEGGLKWQAISMTPADMDFVGLKAAAAREIALAFGVPPMLMGLPGDNAYANYREANRALWRQTIVPLADNILGAIAEALRPWFPDARLSVAVDRVGVLSEERAALWQRVGGADFLSDEEKRRMLGVAP